MSTVDVFLIVSVFFVGVIAIVYVVLYWKLRRKRDGKKYCYHVKCMVCGKRIEVSSDEMNRICLMESDFFIVFNDEICCRSCFDHILILDKCRRNMYLDGLKNV